MEGQLYLHSGIVKGYKKCYAVLNQTLEQFQVLKKSYTGKTYLNIDLQPTQQGECVVKVYPLTTN